MNTIIEKIRAEIERLKKEAEQTASELGYHNDTHNRAEYTANDVRNACIEGYQEALSSILDTLQEKSEKPINPVCEDVEEAARVYSETTPFKFPNQVTAGKQGFIAGANWQRNRLLPMIDNICKVCRIQHEKENPVCEGLEEEIKRVWKTFFFGENGIIYDELDILARHFAQWQKEQMMKDVIEAEFCSEGMFMPMIDFKDKRMDGIKYGDSIKVIVIKEE